jgi:hypothetical protein
MSVIVGVLVLSYAVMCHNGCPCSVVCCYMSVIVGVLVLSYAVTCLS